MVHISLLWYFPPTRFAIVFRTVSHRHDEYHQGIGNFFPRFQSATSPKYETRGVYLGPGLSLRWTARASRKSVDLVQYVQRSSHQFFKKIKEPNRQLSSLPSNLLTMKDTIHRKTHRHHSTFRPQLFRDDLDGKRVLKGNPPRTLQSELSQM